MGASGHASDIARLNAGYDGEWINMILVNGFTPGATVPQYMKNSRGIVRLRGLVVTPGAQVTAWAIPAGHVPNINAVSSQYYDWLNGGSDITNPSRVAQLTVSGLAIGMTSLNAAAGAGIICALDRILWQT
jgi:hypothetical protein